MQKFPLAIALSTSLFSGLAGVACSPAASPPAANGGTTGRGTGGTTSAGSGGSVSSSGGSSGSATGGNSGSGGASAAGGTSGSGGVSGRGGASAGGSTGTGGTAAGGSTGTGGTTTATGGTSGDAGRPDAVVGDTGGSTEKFSFFLTSLDGMRRLSKSQNGFGGDLRFGEATGLAGADKICQTLANDVGFGNKTWKAFLSAVKGGANDGQVNAIDRVGTGPWYDRRGRLIAMNREGLIGPGIRPVGDATAVNDLPDETGQGTKRLGDTHDVITGTNMKGELRTPGNLANTCMDWTSATTRGTIQMGHAWPAGSGMHWIQVHTEPSCVAGVNLVQTGPGNGTSIGAGGGWGAFYCFALTP